MNVFDAAKILGLTGQITKESVKTAYRAAVKKYHPDVNPAGDEMIKVVNQAYEALREYEGEIKEQEQGYAENLNTALNAIFNLEGLIIEICGAWVWVTGETKTHKDTLKEAGFFWAKKKKAWYFRPAEYKSRSKGSSSLEEIREKYGSKRPVFSRKILANA